MRNYEMDPTDKYRDLDAVYVPSNGWWCRDCGVFRSVDDRDICGECRGAVEVRGRKVATDRES